MRLSNDTMRRGRLGLGAAAVLGIALIPACSRSSERPSARAPTTQQRVAAESERERREFIDDTQDRITELDGEIGRLEEQIDRESEFVSETERSEWKEALFELRRQRQDAQARLDRARTATASEWQASRNEVSLQMDRLEAGIQTLGNEISRALAGEPGEEEGREPVRGEEEFEPSVPYEDTPEGMPPGGMSPHEGMPPPQGMPPEGTPPEQGMPPEGMPPEEVPPEGFQPEQ